MKLYDKYLKPFYKKMLLGFTIKSIGAVLELSLPFILSFILKNIVPQKRAELILLWGGIMILFSAACYLCNLKANRMAAKVSRDFSENMRHDLFDKTLRLSARQTDSFTIPSLESRITTDTYNVHSFVNMMQRMGVRAPILLIGGIAATLIMDRYLALTMIALLPPLFVTVMFIRKRGVPLYTRVQKSVDGMVRIVREDAQGIRVIKALSKTDYESARYDSANRALVSNEKKAGITMGLANPVMTLFMNFGIVAVVALSASRVSRGQSDPETVIAFMQYFTMISMAMMSVTRIFMMYTKSSASAKRIAQVLETPQELYAMPKSDFPPFSTDAHIVFDNVSFKYSQTNNGVENISFSIKKGGSLGIIGTTGSGKSTVVSLLMSGYDPDSGAVYINGRDIRTFDPRILHEMFGVALQSDFIYTASIAENIRFLRDINDGDIITAAKIAQADEFITAFPDGYEHMLSQNGTNVSGGQRQRLLIARAIAAKPDILILDDSSSALDYKTDAALRQALKEQMHGTTVITVAQRVSSVKSCDEIIVTDNGRIIGRGSHEQLLETCDRYRQISISQMGGGDIIE